MFSFLFSSSHMSFLSSVYLLFADLPPYTVFLLCGMLIYLQEALLRLLKDITPPAVLTKPCSHLRCCLTFSQLCSGRASMMSLSPAGLGRGVRSSWLYTAAPAPQSSYGWFHQYSHTHFPTPGIELCSCHLEILNNCCGLSFTHPPFIC